MNGPAPSAVLLQRVDAAGSIEAARRGPRSRLAGLFQEGAARIRFPRPTGAALEAVLINTAGGMTGGDRLRWRATAGQGAHLSLTTQACEKVYKAGSGEAKVDVSLSVSAGGRLAWLPQETILFDRSAFRRTLHVDLAAGASCLIVEATILGRAAMGETVTSARFRDRWRVRSGGRMVHAEDFRFEGDATDVFSRPANGHGATAFASVLAIGDGMCDRLGDVRETLSGRTGVRAGASAWNVAGNGKLLARIVAADGYCLRNALAPLVGLLNGQAGLPRIWTS